MAKKKTTSKKSTNKKVMKAATKMAKKNPGGFIVLVVVLIVLLALGAGGYFVYTNYIAPKKANETSQNVSSRPTYVGDSKAIDINFLELGN